MRVTEKRIQIDSTYFSPERDVRRSKGLHLSNVIDFIEWKEGKRDVMPDGKLSQAGNAYSAAGFLWERAIANLIERSPTELWEWIYGRTMSEPDNPKVFRPGECQMDGGECQACKGKGTLLEPVRLCDVCGGTGRILIFLTPDGINIEDGYLEEYKFTTKSSKNEITGPKFRRWLSFQIPAYLKAVNLTICRLRVYFSRGDYTTGEPFFFEYILSYTQQEIDETWDMIVQHAQIMRREGLC